VYENKISAQRYAVVVENMTLPVAVFLYKEHAETWKSRTYGHRAIVVECQDAPLLRLESYRDCSNPEPQQLYHNGCIG